MMSNMMRALILALALIIAESANDQDCYFYDALWEWAGIFETPKEGNYTWIAQKVGGDYADPSMKLVVFPATTASKPMLLSHQTSAMHAMGLTCIEVQNGGVMIPKDDRCYKLIFDAGSRETMFMVDATGVPDISFFAEHVPTEFEDGGAEDGKHYLKDNTGADIEPVAQLPEGDGHHHHHAGEDKHAGGAGDDPYLQNCVCQAQRFGWKLDCSTMAPVNAAVVYLNGNLGDCLTENPTAECKKQYHILQAHHDHCLHHDLAEDVETHLHYFEKYYEDCKVDRQYDPDLSQCPPVDCNNAEALQAAVLDLNCGCTATCATKCAAAIKTVLMAHDVCAETSLPTKLEVALHDHEDVCASELCNSQATATFNPYDFRCGGEASATIGFGSQWTSFVIVLALSLAVSFSS